ncbi:MAG: peptidylprolyl isomerase [Cytophagales bacterium]
MGIINTLREKMGRFVVFAVGLSILAFVAADLLGPNSSLLGGGQQTVGVIAEQKVSYPEFVQEFERLKTNYSLANNESPGSEIQNQLREQTWNNFLIKYAFQKEFEAIGLEVTDEEKIDMVQGVNIHPSIVQSFTDENGQFDKSRVINFLQNFDQLEPQMQYNWAQFEKNLGPERMQNKMNSLLQKSVFVNKYEALSTHIKSEAKINGRFLYVPYFSITDSTVEVSDALLKDILKERKEEFKKSDNFSIDYITFKVEPSSEDSLYFVEEMSRLAKDFESVKDDTSFIKLNSDLSELPTLYRPDQLPIEVASRINSLDSGDVFGPIANTGNLEIYKLMGTISDTSGEYAQASHILFKTDDGDAEAKSKARGILRQLQNGADFAEMAREHSEGPSGPNGGELGWFGRGQMVTEFENAVFNAKREGVINELIKTQFGYHIINVTATASKEKYLVGKITREITPSDETANEVFRKADVFAATVSSPEEFSTKAEEMGLSVQSARNIGKNDRTINALSNIREVIRWGFSDASAGDISEVFETGDLFLIALLTEKNEEGYADLEDVRERLMPIALKKVKTDEIIKRLKELNIEDLDDAAESYGSSASVYQLSGTSFNTNTLTGAGFDPAAVGFAFGMEAGEKSEPYQGENGVLVFEINDVIPANPAEDINSIKQNQVQQRMASVPIELTETIKEKAEIEDNRFRFF